MNPAIILIACFAWIGCLSHAATAHGSSQFEKPKYLWFDAEANFERFSHKDSIRYYLDKTKETGFSHIVVDVRPIYGQVLYKRTKRMQPISHMRGKSVDRKWDYLKFFIKEARKRKLKVIASATIFPAGNPSTREGLAYEDSTWASKTVIEWTPDGLKDIKDDKTKVAAFLNPSLPEVQDYALECIREIVSGYDIDGFALDYCRYPDVQSDFSETSRRQFESYIGERVPSFPADIFHWNGRERTDGPYAKKWFEFRSKVIHDFIQKARTAIKAIKPRVQVELWSPSWYGGLYENGQNWADKSYDPSMEYHWAGKGYSQTGFADLLDVFLLGTYLKVVYGLDNPESIEYGIKRAKRLTKGSCSLFGTIMATINRADLPDAVAVCLEQTDGLMVFDIVHVIEQNTWNELKRGIERAEQRP